MEASDEASRVALGQMASWVWKLVVVVSTHVETLRTGVERRSRERLVVWLFEKLFMQDLNTPWWVNDSSRVVLSSEYSKTCSQSPTCAFDSGP